VSLLHPGVTILPLFINLRFRSFNHVVGECSLAQELRAGIGALASSNVKKKAKQASSFKVHLGSPFALKWCDIPSPIPLFVRGCGGAY
jgi:hypothetical protein